MLYYGVAFAPCLVFFEHSWPERCSRALETHNSSSYLLPQSHPKHIPPLTQRLWILTPGAEISKTLQLSGWNSGLGLEVLPPFLSFPLQTAFLPAFVNIWFQVVRRAQCDDLTVLVTNVINFNDKDLQINLTALIFVLSFSIQRKPTQMQDFTVQQFFHTGLSSQVFISTFIAINRTNTWLGTRILHYHLAVLLSGFNSTRLLLCQWGFFYIICDFSLSFIYCFEALICSALSSGFLQLHLIYTVSSVMSEQLLLNQQEYFSGQHTFKQDNNSVKTLDSDLAAQSTQNHTLMIAFYLDHS